MHDRYKRWKLIAIIVNCLVTTCPNIKNTDEIKVQLYSHDCGAKEYYSCRDPYMTLKGPGERTCNEKGLWTGKEPK